jgi:hypothetical protein
MANGLPPDGDGLLIEHSWQVGRLLALVKCPGIRPVGVGKLGGEPSPSAFF